MRSRGCAFGKGFYAGNTRPLHLIHRIGGMTRSTLSLLRAALAVCAVAASLGGCAVVSIAATGVGLAADVAVGAVKVTGKAVGAAASAVLPGESK